MSDKDGKRISGRGDNELAAEDLLKLSDEIAAEFPPPRLGTELVLLEVDPQRAHAYWNIDLEDFLDAKLDSGQGNPPLIIRTYDVTGISFDGTNALETFDAEIQGLQGHWYMDLWKQGRSYVAEIGFRRGDGSLAFIARSNEVHTPTATQSLFSSTEVLDLTDRATVPDISAQVKEITAPSVEGARPPRIAIVHDAYPAEVAGTSPAAAVSEIAPWPDPEDGAGDEPKVREKIKEFYKDMTEPASAISEAESSMEREVENGPVAEPAPNVPEPLESHVNYSSFEQGRRSVDLEINTELHIYGRAKPGSDLVLFGQKVPLRPDGTFSIRKPLPQGAVVIPLLFSSNKD